MKTLKLFSVFLLAILSFQLFAAPVYYTFEGEVDNIFGDEAWANSKDFFVGDDTKFVLSVDWDVPAEAIYLSDNSVYTYGDNSYMDYGYLNLIEGNYLGGVIGSFHNYAASKSSADEYSVFIYGTYLSIANLYTTNNSKDA